MKTPIIALALATTFSFALTANAQDGDPPTDEDMAPVGDEPAEPAEPEPAPGPPPVPVTAPPPGSGGGMGGFETPVHLPHTGFFARVHLGFGYQQMTEEFMGNDLKVSGTAGGFFLALGYSVIPRLAVYLNLGGVSIIGPTIEVNGVTDEASDDVAATTAGIGIGATYYLPSNIFFGGSMIAGVVSITDDGDEVAESDTGVALTLEGGKEWWVGSNFGVGAMAQLMIGSFPDGGAGVDANVATTAFTINLTGTYN